MPRSLPLPVRHRIFERLQLGHSPTQIARDLRLCPRTVRHLCQRFRQHGEPAVPARYQTPPAATPSRAVELALLLHQQHPSWGAPYVRIQLQQQHPQLDLPCARTLQRWFRRFEQPPAPPGRKPPQHATRATAVHEVWQMDAVEQLKLQTGQQVAWLRWVDEYSGAVLGTVVFPLRHLWRSARRRRSQRLAWPMVPLGTAWAFACW